VIRLFLVLSLVYAIVQTQLPASTPQTPTPQTPTNTSPESPTNASPASPTTPVAPDPSAVTFATDLGMLLVVVKPDKVADYEAAIVALQSALSKSEDPDVRTLAEGWQVYKTAEVDNKANAIYVHLLNPVVPAADYRPSIWLDKLLEGAPPDLLGKYRDAFASPPTKLPLVKFADMTMPPAAPANASPAEPLPPVKPGNGSPPGPTPLAPPGR
jgi:hypothetical protein